MLVRAMINRIKAFFSDHGRRASAGGGSRHSHDELHLAAAALLVEAAQLDGDFEARERTKISELLRSRFGLNGAEAETLIATATAAQEANSQLLPYTRIIKQQFSEDERVELVEMLWEVAYADNVLHDFEANLLRRIGGLIYVPDRERGEAKKRVLKRLKITATGKPKTAGTD